MELKEKYNWPDEKPDVEENQHGWFLEDAAEVLSSFLNEDTKLIVELGSWVGKSTRHMLEAAPNATIIAVDHWKGSAKSQHMPKRKKMLPTLYETFLVNCWKFKDRLIPLKSDTLSGLQEIHDNDLSPDLVYIDADHSYEMVLKDIRKTIELFPNAQIVGDDWLWRGKRRPVERAVKECAEEFGFNIETIGNTWYLKKRIQRVLICGCARSGNTLMMSLIETGFSDIAKTIDGPGNESVPKAKDIVKDKVLLGKFPKSSGKLDKHLASKDLGVIFMMRDPRDVLVSKHYLKPNIYWVQPERWMRNAEFARKHQDHSRVLLVKYEDVLTSPNKVQNEISDKFGLTMLRQFDECHLYFDENDEANIGAMNGVRPLDSSRIGNWKDDPAKMKRIKKIMKQHPEIETYMDMFGYSQDISA